jgi:hypothetical protein
MSFLSSQGQLIDAPSITVAVLAGGALTGVADELYASGTYVFPAGWYLVSFTTAIGGTITSGYLEFQVGGVDVAQTQLFGAGTYTLTAPIYLSGPDAFTLEASGTGATWTSSASNLYFIRMS